MIIKLKCVINKIKVIKVDALSQLNFCENIINKVIINDINEAKKVKTLNNLINLSPA